MKREATGGPALESWAEVVHAHEQAQRRADLEVSHIRRLSVQHPGGDPGVDPVEQRGQRS